MKRSNIFIKDGKSIVQYDTAKYMESLFRKHEKDGFIGCGYDWGSIMLCFIDENHFLKELWKYFDYDPHNDSIFVISDNEQSLMTFINEFDKICDDEQYIEYLMSLIDYS